MAVPRTASPSTVLQLEARKISWWELANPTTAQVLHCPLSRLPCTFLSPRRLRLQIWGSLLNGYTLVVTAQNQTGITRFMDAWPVYVTTPHDPTTRTAT